MAQIRFCFLLSAFAFAFEAGDVLCCLKTENRKLKIQKFPSSLTAISGKADLITTTNDYTYLR